MIGMFCDEKGNTQCGTDTMFHVNGNFGVTRRLDAAMMQRERFRKNFLHKFEAFSHVYFVNRPSDPPARIYKVPVNTAAVAVTG